MNIFGAPWFEIWIDDSARPAYVLIVEPEEVGEGCVVIDPKKNYAVVHRGESYTAIRVWLQEDEYRLAKGRMFHE
ncbi:MAG: hypothetical protein QOH49_2599 [Acidobacteriota bacterium]|jgi:hypothetical protein|nr:hypothetical protein [Acidobacteriota bacterium]